MPENKRFSLRGLLLCVGLIAFVGTCSCGQNKRTTTAPEIRREPPVASTPETHTAVEPTIRVACLKDASTVRLTGGSGNTLTASDGRVLQQFPANMQLDIVPTPSGLSINGVAVNEPRVTLSSSQTDSYISVNMQEVAPRLSVLKSGGSLTVVAQLEIEDYLCGVLAGEVPFERWHMEALKAQAITSRSYALFQVQQKAGEPYDVESTVMSQVFKPGFRHNPILQGACNATRGLILTSSGQQFPAYFHSTCGGMTAPAAQVFPDYGSVKALSGTLCPYCQASPSYRWRMTLSKDMLVSKLHGQYPGIKSVASVEFLDGRGAVLGTGAPIGRAATVRIQHSGGTMQMQGNAFRLMVSPKDLKSLLVEQAVDRGDSIELAGGGFGHGVGLCQYGSQGMANTGKPYTAILGMYFPGAALTKTY